MKKILCILLLLYLFGCNNRSSNKSSTSNNQTDTTSFFPVNDYLREEIDEVLKTPFLIYNLKKENNKLVDSSVIPKEAFSTIAQSFLNDSITNPSLKQQYSSTLFHDLSTKSFVFTYSALKDELPVRTVTILLNDENNKLKSVFISALNISEYVKEEKLIWTAGKRFSINRTMITADKKEIEQTTFVIWNDK